MAKLSDSDAKDILRDSKYWPTCTTKWGVQSPSHYWIRCRPSDAGAPGGTMPGLKLPGATAFKTQPDGLWAYFHGLAHVDVLAVEVCGSIQNLNDKRSRYLSIGSSLLVTATSRWFRGEVTRTNGGRMPRSRACGSFSTAEITRFDAEKQGKFDVPVRFLRVLFVIPDEEYSSWMQSNVPAGHEFYMKHNSLKTATSPDTQEFLARMSFQSHFRTRS